ncbi:hypothetical protein BRD08_06800 [Halobacteriales archaeon SW_10_66_29]|nr:MAG: hypothetical protein BRD08_06800 [Halobacteriales archaeon SW_10_66_29]
MVEEWQATALEDGSSGFQDVTVPGRPAAFAGAEGVRYRTRFDDPRDPGDDVAVVELEGVYARAEVEATGERLDGDWVAEHDAYFEPLRIPLRPDEENELVVTCRAPDDRFGGIHDSELVPEALRIPGIWWDAALETCTLPTIDSLTVTPEVTEEGAQLHVETTVLTDGPVDERITYSLRPEGDLNARGMMERTSVETDAAGKTTVEHTVEIRDPALWWPRELGRQHHYTLTAKLDGTEHSQKTGFCEVGFEDGQFRVNGEPLNVRGVNLLTDSPDELRRGGAARLAGPAADRPREVRRRPRRDPRTGALPTVRRPPEPRRIRCPRRSRRRLRERSRRRVPRGPAAPLAGLAQRLRRRPRRGGRRRVPGRPPGVPGRGRAGPRRRRRLVLPRLGLRRGDGHRDATGALPDRRRGGVRCRCAAGRRRRGGRRRCRLRRRETRQQGGWRPRGLPGLSGGSPPDDQRTTAGTPKASTETLARSFAPLQAFLADPTPGTSEVIVANDTPANHDLAVEWSAGEESGSFDAAVDAQGRWRGGSVTVPGEAEGVSILLRVDDHEIENQYDI